MSSDFKTILVTGATGKQGRAVISALLSTQQRFRILALTRNPTSSAAKGLLALTSDGSGAELTLVKGDLDNINSMTKVFKDVVGGVWGVFAVLAFPGLGANADGEEKQGITLVDLSLEYGVSHFMFSSVERGGETFDHYFTLDRAAKVKIEQHVKASSAKGMKWTILRPGFFMENFDGSIGRITSGVLRCGLQPTTKLQLVAVEDIGNVAAAVFLDSEKYVDRIIVVVGDVLTASEQDAAYMRAIKGRHLPSVPDFVAKVLLAVNTHTRALIADIERVHRDRCAMAGGHEGVLEDVKVVYPGMMTFETWAARTAADARTRTSAGTQGTTSVAGWNRVSIPALVLGKR